MEHEDNAHLDNILQGSQHLMENLQMASGDSMCDNVVDDIGGKFEEHEVHDDEEEWKYIKEGQQSEKQHQQQMDAGIDFKDMEGVKEVGNGYGYAYEHGNVGADGMPLLDQHEVDNGVVGISAAVDANFLMNTPTGHEDEDIIKNDGDFSSTSNTISTNGEDGGNVDVLQVEMKIESTPASQLMAQQSEDMSGKGLTEEDDEPSSLTNGTNSLSENAPPQQQIEPQQTGGSFAEEFSIEDKENADPLLNNAAACSGNNDTPERPADIDFEEMHSQLNPNATEFVPNFGSNPGSPIAPTNAASQFLADEEQLHPTAIPHHLLSGDDDFVAQSPRKGSASDSNFDGIAIPDQVIDFKHEAAKRPHELEQEDDLIAVIAADQHTEQESQLHFEQTANLLKDDFTDYRQQSPSSMLDHGPETCVDLDADLDMQPIECIKGDVQEVELSTKGDMNESIVDLLNTVQQLPIEDEEVFQQEAFAEKELLDVEEKENISNPPSTEEMQMNMQNELHSSTKDIPQIPIDMDNASNMQESFYLESTSSEMQQQHNAQVIDNDFDSKPVFGFDEPNTNTNMDEHAGIDDISFQTMRAAEPNAAQIDFEDRLGDAAPASYNLFNSACMPAPQTDVSTPSPVSTEEKHLVEETKEQAHSNENLYELEHKMDSLLLSKQDEILATKDEILSQVEEVAQTAANIVESMNPFSAPEPEQHETLEQMPIEANHSFSTESQPHAADFLQQNHEQSYDNEQMEQQHQTAQDVMQTEPVYAHHENDIFMTQPAEQQPTVYPTKIDFEMNGFENSSTPFSIEGNIGAPITEAEVLVPSAEPTFEPMSVAKPEEFESQPALELSSDIVSNLPTANEAFLTAAEAPVSITADATSAPLPDSTESSTNNELLAVAVGVGAIAATTSAALTVAAAKDDKKPDTKKPRTPTSTKSKAAPLDAKKAAEPFKKPIGTTTKTTVSSTTTSAAARPRTAPAKSTTLAEKKSTTSTATRKPLTSTASTKTITKTTAARPTTAPAAAKAATAPRTTTTARRSAQTTTAGGSSTTANGLAANTKPKPMGSAPTKPTTLGLSTTTKPKLSSPRTTLTSQLRRTAPTATSTGTGATTTARSPLKTTAPTTNSISKSLANTTAASRAKSATSSTTTTTTKTFTARPAPKTTHSTTLSTTTTRRTTSSAPSSTSTKTTTSSTLLQKKTPPGNSTRLTTTTTSGKSSLSPNKTTTTSATLKVKAKDVPKKNITPTKPTDDNKAKPIKRPAHMNGGTTAVNAAESTADTTTENTAQLNGKGDGAQLEQLENGIHHVELENGNGALLEQQAPVGLIDA